MCNFSQWTILFHWETTLPRTGLTQMYHLHPPMVYRRFTIITNYDVMGGGGGSEALIRTNFMLGPTKVKKVTVQFRMC